MAKYNLFISYSREDERIVKPLVQFLRISEKMVFQDIDSIQPGAKWNGVIVDAIENCDKLILFWCCHSSNSLAVKNEYELAIAQNKSIVPVLIDNTELPELVKQFQWIDMQALFSPHEGYVKTYIPGMIQGKFKERWDVIIPEKDLLLAAASYLKKELNGLLNPCI